jgi:glycosyltransferase involved in cell wall biosynthesis
MKTTLITYVYPGVENYLNKLLDSLNKQTDTDFEVLFFNDGIPALDWVKNIINIPFKIIPISGSPNEIRFKSLKIITDIDTDVVIFQDADDFPDLNRIEEVKKAMKSHDLVVNDLNIIYDNENLVESRWWYNRLENNILFEYEFIKYKNIVGLGNSAIKKTLLNPKNLMFDELPIAFDWFMFYQIMYNNKLKGLFINTTCTNYRQHHKNLAGFKKMDKPRILRVLDVKFNHYKALQRIGFDFLVEIKEIEAIRKHFLTQDTIKENRLILNPFWWEETQLL